MNIQNRENYFTAGAHAIKQIKIFRSCSRFKTISQLLNNHQNCQCCGHNEQKTMFRGDLLFLFYNLKSQRHGLAVSYRAQVTDPT